MCAVERLKLITADKVATQIAYENALCVVFAGLDVRLASDLFQTHTHTHIAVHIHTQARILSTYRFVCNSCVVFVFRPSSGLCHAQGHLNAPFDVRSVADDAMRM